MTTLEFQPWPKIARLNRDITVTEKIDGTNAAVVIRHKSEIDHIQHENGLWDLFDNAERNLTTYVGDYAVFAQSRTRFITPERDNYGFAKWVQANAEALVETLGAGTHFGEWWGSGIQRKYGLTGGDKRFSLFNTARWGNDWPGKCAGLVPGLSVVPTLYRGPFSQLEINRALNSLRLGGSRAAPGFMRPEGIVVWHDAARQSFKVTLEGDEAPKGQEAHRFDEEIAA
jgi:hypothetical protein